MRARQLVHSARHARAAHRSGYQSRGTEHARQRSRKKVRGDKSRSREPAVGKEYSSGDIGDGPVGGGDDHSAEYGFHIGFLAIDLGVPEGTTDGGIHTSGYGRCSTGACGRLTAPLHAYCCLTCFEFDGRRHAPDCATLCYQRRVDNAANAAATAAPNATVASVVAAPLPQQLGDGDDDDDDDEGATAAPLQRGTRTRKLKLRRPRRISDLSAEDPTAAPKRPAERPAMPRSVRGRAIGLGVPASTTDGEVHTHGCGRCCTRSCIRLTEPLHAFCCITCKMSEGRRHAPDCDNAMHMSLGRRRSSTPTSQAPPPPDDDDDTFIDGGDDDDAPLATPPPHVALPPPNDDDDVFIDDGEDDDEPLAAPPPHVALPPPDSDDDIFIDDGDDDDEPPTVVALPPQAVPVAVCSVRDCCRPPRLWSISLETYTGERVCCLECVAGAIGDHNHSSECNNAAAAWRRQQLSRVTQQRRSPSGGSGLHV